MKRLVSIKNVAMTSVIALVGALMIFLSASDEPRAPSRPDNQLGNPVKPNPRTL